MVEMNEGRRLLREAVMRMAQEAVTVMGVPVDVGDWHELTSVTDDPPAHELQVTVDGRRKAITFVPGRIRAYAEDPDSRPDTDRYIEQAVWNLVREQG